MHMKDTNRKPLNYNEIKVRFIYEQIFRTKLIDGDRPDIYASDNSLDIEATSAGGINCKINFPGASTQMPNGICLLLRRSGVFAPTSLRSVLVCGDASIGECTLL